MNAYQEVAEQGARFNLENDGELLPVALLFREQEPLAFMALRVGNDEEKEVSAAAIRATAQELHADTLVLIVEAWVLFASPDKVATLRPSESPDRKEAVVITLEQRGAPVRQGYGPIIRSGGKVTVGEFTWTTPPHLEGRFAGLLTGGEQS